MQMTILEGVIPLELVSTLHYYVMERNRQYRADERHSTACFTDQRIFDLLGTKDCFTELLLNPAILDASREMLGSGFILSAFESNTIYPDPCFEMDWHIDYPYNIEAYGLKCGLTESLAIQVIVPLVDSANPSGCTLIQDVPDSQSRCGDVLISRPDILHTSSINHSKIPRPAILMQFVKPYITPQTDFSHLAKGDLKQLLGGVPYTSKVTTGVN